MPMKSTHRTLLSGRMKKSPRDPEDGHLNRSRSSRSTRRQSGFFSKTVSTWVLSSLIHGARPPRYGRRELVDGLRWYTASNLYTMAELSLSVDGVAAQHEQRVAAFSATV